MIDQKKFFKIVEIVGVKEVALRLKLRNTTVYGWRSSSSIPPLQWVRVNNFMKKFEEDNKDLLSKRLAELDEDHN